jgi:ribonuclease Z
MPPATWSLVARPIALAGASEEQHSLSTIILDDGAVRITAIEVNHEPVSPAIAYRFDYKGRSVVVSGDLKYHAPLADAARGADVLVMEAISRPMTKALSDGAAAAGRERQAAIMHDIQDYHIDPTEAATIANSADVKLLLFYHLLPAPDTFLTRRLFARGIERVRRDGWRIADDGTMVTLPAGGSDVHVSHIDQ